MLALPQYQGKVLLAFVSYPDAGVKTPQSLVCDNPSNRELYGRVTNTVLKELVQVRLEIPKGYLQTQVNIRIERPELATLSIDDNQPELHHSIVGAAVKMDVDK